MKIGTLEFIATVGCVGIIPLVLTIPTFSAQEYGTGAMAHTFYIILVDAICLFLLFYLYFQFPGKDILDISEETGGVFFKYLTTILAMIYLLTSAIVVLAEFNENIKNILFPNAPSEYVYLIFGVGLFIGVLNGIDGIFRAATIVSPTIIISLLFLFCSLYKDVDITNYTPILGIQPIPFFHDALKIEFFEGMILILFLGAKLKNPKKAAVWSFILITMMILIISILLYGIIPYPSITENYFPFFELSRLMSFGRFWQRVESIYTLIWLIAVYIYISIGPSFTTLMLTKVFHVSTPQRLVPIICLLVLNVALLFPSYVAVLETRKLLIHYFTPVLVFWYPTVILAIANLKKRRKAHAQNR